ncbi:tetratricopeptide repeat protein [Candidatus Obscuribacterales bacterium]|nr:tetratricopeptide repeat protein [Candidatus Obscuribacterales bacterium]
MKKRHEFLLAASLTLALFTFNQAAFADSQTEPTAPISAPLGISQDEQAFLQSTDAKWSKMIDDGTTMLTNGKETPAISMFKRALTQISRVDADQNAKDRMTAIANKKLGQCYCQKGDYEKADAQLQEAKAAYARLAINDDELAHAFDELGKHYKTIDPLSFGESVTKQMKQACVNKIAVFMLPDKDVVEVSLEQKYVKDVGSKDVPKISFNKKVSFEFLNRPNGDYQVSKITGLQVLAKTLWVNLLESLVKVGEKPVAEVTAGKMGMTKTVTVDLPKDMFDSTKAILDNLIASIKGQPAYAATTTAPSSTPAEGQRAYDANMNGYAAGSTVSQPNGAASVIQSVPGAVPGVEATEQLNVDSIPSDQSNAQNTGTEPPPNQD